MYATKAAVFNYLSKNQKASLCGYLRSLVKRCNGLSAQEITDEFIEDEMHFADMGSPNFHFALENFTNDTFLEDIKKYVKALIKDEQYKKALKEEQKPFIEKQKQYMKEQRRQAQEYKMAREKPTVKQLKYYKSLCKSKNVDPGELEGATRLDLKNWIEKMVENAQGN